MVELDIPVNGVDLSLSKATVDLNNIMIIMMIIMIT